jgi:hypothetical protein
MAANPLPLWLGICCLVAAAGLTGCAASVNRFTIDHVVALARANADTGKVCMMGAALVHPIGAVDEDAHLALAIAEGVSAVCDQSVAWEADLAAARMKHNGAALGEGRAAEIIDAQLLARRAHARTAARFNRAYTQIESAFGPIGAECPSLNKREEFTYLFGLIAGTLALIHDSTAGGLNGVPHDRLGAVARGSRCLDDARWWYVPQALRGAAWAMVPGSGPNGVDGWQVLDQAATLGSVSGVRVAAAIEVLVAGNAGRTQVLERALAQHADARTKTAADAEWLLLDTYATEISTHQSDLVWSEATGHRTEVFGLMPGKTFAAPAEDPFTGTDPFNAP